MKNPKELVLVENVETSFHQFLQDSKFSGPYQIRNSLKGSNQEHSKWEQAKIARESSVHSQNIVLRKIDKKEIQYLLLWPLVLKQKLKKFWIIKYQGTVYLFWKATLSCI